MNTVFLAQALDPTGPALQSLSFSTSTWLVLVSLLACVLCGVLSWIAVQRSGFTGSVIALESLRFLAVVVGAILLNQPEWVQDYRSSQKPTFSVLVDRSPSMQTQDVVGADKVTTRLEATERLIAPEAWEELSRTANVVITEFPPKGTADGTDLATPLGNVLDDSSNVLGVLVVSDGDWNAGAAPVSVTSRYRTQGVPIFALPVGASTRLPDLELLSIDTPTFGIVKKGVRIPFTIESSLPRDVMTQVVIKTSDGERQTKEVRVRAMSRTSEAVVWTPKEEGDYTIEVEVPQHSDTPLKSRCLSTQRNRLPPTTLVHHRYRFDKRNSRCW